MHRKHVLEMMSVLWRFEAPQSSKPEIDDYRHAKLAELMPSAASIQYIVVCSVTCTHCNRFVMGTDLSPMPVNLAFRCKPVGTIR